MCATGGSKWTMWVSCGEKSAHAGGGARLSGWRRTFSIRSTRGGGLACSGGHLTTGTVEALLEQIAALSPEPAGSIERFELEVPEHLTLRGKGCPPDFAMAILLDALFAKGFDPSSCRLQDGDPCATLSRPRKRSS